MNIVVWMLAGATLGWAAYLFLGFRAFSIVVAAIGGYFGGQVVAPLFTAAALPGDFSLSALPFAAAVAAAFLTVGNMVYERWGV